MKKIIVGLFLVLILVNSLNVFATSSDETFTFEYEAKHISEHYNARIQEKLHTRITKILTAAIIIDCIIFCILAIKNKKIIFPYIISLAIILIIYIIGSIAITKLYPSMFAMDYVNQNMLIGIISISILLGAFCVKNKTRVVFSSLVALAVLIFCIFGAFITYINVEYLVKDIINAFEYFISIEISSQVLLLPIYLKNRNRMQN